jgi:hypothetical protein
MQSKNNRARHVVLCAAAGITLACGFSSVRTDLTRAASPTSTATTAPATQTSKIPLTFTAGYETDSQDRGRPAILVAAGLGVPAEVFRQAFTHVTPAPAGREPDPVQVRRNKDALLQALSQYGVTNDLLDKVSNHYRYNRGKGELWRHTPATAYATIRNGVISEIVITTPGTGYSSPPKVSIPDMPKVKLKATLSFSADLDKNGSIKEIKITADPPAIDAQ